MAMERAATTAPADFRADPGALEAAARLKRRYDGADPLSRLPDVHPDRIPRHIAFIMDGNGRWAARQGMPRVLGHRAGAVAARAVARECGRLGVECVTLYSFSLENWKRPKAEIDALMELCVLYLDKEREELRREGVRFRVVGRREGLPERVVRAIEETEGATSHCAGCTLCLALNYGSRAEIVDAARALARDARAGVLDPEAIDEEAFGRRLYTSGLPDPDLLVRTAGEMRVSNYLLWQISYAELYVTDTLWPDFGNESLYAAVRAFAARSRRFGGLDTRGPGA